MSTIWYYWVPPGNVVRAPGGQEGREKRKEEEAKKESTALPIPSWSPTKVLGQLSQLNFADFTAKPGTAASLSFSYSRLRDYDKVW